MNTEAGEQIVECCEHLRTKSQYFEPTEQRAGRGFVRVSNMATYWCTRTQAVLGPDGAPGGPAQCQPGRTCYQRD
ncbi:MAG: hypothetical protein U1D55_03795 [Phycisphaerae bacterium]